MKKNEIDLYEKFLFEFDEWKTQKSGRSETNPMKKHPQFIKILNQKKDMIEKCIEIIKKENVEEKKRYVNLKKDLKKVKSLEDKSGTKWNQLQNIRKRLYDIKEMTNENMELFLEICTFDKSWNWKKDWISLDKILELKNEKMMKIDKIHLYEKFVFEFDKWKNENIGRSETNPIP